MLSKTVFVHNSVQVADKLNPIYKLILLLKVIKKATFDSSLKNNYN